MEGKEPTDTKNIENKIDNNSDNNFDDENNLDV